MGDGVGKIISKGQIMWKESSPQELEMEWTVEHKVRPLFQ